jgi:hypothetical protein
MELYPSGDRPPVGPAAGFPVDIREFTGAVVTLHTHNLARQTMHFDWMNEDGQSLTASGRNAPSLISPLRQVRRWSKNIV